MVLMSMVLYVTRVRKPSRLLLASAKYYLMTRCGSAEDLDQHYATLQHEKEKAVSLFTSFRSKLSLD